MNFDKFFEKKFYVKGTETSKSMTIFPSVLLGDMQETAECGVKQYDIGTYELGSKGYCWIILQMSVRLTSLPKWKDTFKIRTWNSGIEGLFYTRQYRIFDDDNNEIGCANSKWIIADINTHRPVRPKVISELFDDPDSGKVLSVPQDEPCVNVEIPKLVFPDTASLGTSIITKYADYSEIDHNNHVNNTRYISWAYDCLNKAGIDTEKVREFDITYHAEVKEGSQAELYLYKQDGYCFVVGVVEDKKVFIFRCR